MIAAKYAPIQTKHGRRHPISYNFRAGIWTPNYSFLSIRDEHFHSSIVSHTILCFAQKLQMKFARRIYLNEYCCEFPSRQIEEQHACAALTTMVKIKPSKTFMPFKADRSASEHALRAVIFFVSERSAAPRHRDKKHRRFVAGVAQGNI
jgi:hypothetical protein